MAKHKLYKTQNTKHKLLQFRVFCFLFCLGFVQSVLCALSSRYLLSFCAFLELLVNPCLHVNDNVTAVDAAVRTDDMRKTGLATLFARRNARRYKRKVGAPVVAVGAS